MCKILGVVGFSNIYVGGVMHPIISTTHSNFQISVGEEIGVKGSSLMLSLGWNILIIIIYLMCKILGVVGFSNIHLGGVMHPIILTTRSNFQISVGGEIGVRAVHVNLEWRSHDSLCKECHELTCPLLSTYIVATR